MNWNAEFDKIGNKMTKIKFVMMLGKVIQSIFHMNDYLDKRNRFEFNEAQFNFYHIRFAKILINRNQNQLELCKTGDGLLILKENYFINNRRIKENFFNNCSIS
jgi:hypothetical protein